MQLRNVQRRFGDRYHDQATVVSLASLFADQVKNWILNPRVQMPIIPPLACALHRVVSAWSTSRHRCTRPGWCVISIYRAIRPPEETADCTLPPKSD